MNKIKGHEFEFTIEHVIPRSNGGTNSPLNKLPCCRKCNSMKADNSIDYFLSQINFMASVNVGSKNVLKRWRHMEKNTSYIKEAINKYKKEIFRYGKKKINLALN